MNEGGGKEFKWGGWTKPYDYLLAEARYGYGRKATDIVGYAWDADLHTPEETLKALKAGVLKATDPKARLDQHKIPERGVEDREGNEIHPVFASDPEAKEFFGEAEDKYATFFKGTVAPMKLNKGKKYKLGDILVTIKSSGELYRSGDYSHYGVSYQVEFPHPRNARNTIQGYLSMAPNGGFRLNVGGVVIIRAESGGFGMAQKTSEYDWFLNHYRGSMGESVESIEVSEATTDTDRISRKIAAIVNEFADNLFCGMGDHCDLPYMRSYSGRGMYGKYCLGVSVSRYDMNSLLKEFKQKGIPEPSKDTLGMGAILYWQNIPHDPKIHINHHVKDDIDESVEVTEDLGDSRMGGVNFYKERTEPYQGLPDETIIGCYRGDEKVAEIWQDREDPKNHKKVTGYTVYPPTKGAALKSFGTMPLDKPRYPSVNAAFAAARKFVVGLKTEETELGETTELLNESEGDWIIRFSRFPYQSAQKMKEKAKYVKAVVSTNRNYLNPDEIDGTIIYSHNLKYPIDFSNLRRMTQLLDKIKGPNGTFREKIGTTAFGPVVIRNPFGEIDENAVPAAAGQATLKAGDILVCEWGVTMSLVDFYKVVSVSGEWVNLVKLGSRSVSGDWAGGKMAPTSEVVGGNIRRKMKRWKDHRGNERISVIINPSAKQYATLWDGNPVYYNTMD